MCLTCVIKLFGVETRYGGLLLAQVKDISSLSRFFTKRLSFLYIPIMCFIVILLYIYTVVDLFYFV